MAFVVRGDIENLRIRTRRGIRLQVAREESDMYRARGPREESYAPRPVDALVKRDTLVSCRVLRGYGRSTGLSPSFFLAFWSEVCLGSLRRYDLFVHIMSLKFRNMSSTTKPKSLRLYKFKAAAFVFFRD